MIAPEHEQILDHFTTPVLICNELAQIEFSNAAFCAWMGIGARRWFRQPLSALNPSQGDLPALLARARSERRVERLGPVKLNPLPDCEREAIISIAPWRGAGSEISALLEFRVLNEEFEPDPAQRLPQAMAATLKGLAHEVRNPLAGLRGAAQLLARRLQDSDSRRYLDVIEAESERLLQLVERLLSPKPSHAFEALNIHEVLERVRLLTETDAGWAVHVVRDYDPSLPPVMADRDRLIQAVLNIVRNALEADASEVRLRTRVEFHHALDALNLGKALRIDVIDNGRGVPEALAPQLFLPLVSGRAEGSGLGLALAQEIAREHGGMLSFKSRPGHTVFTLLLPFAGDAPPADSATESNHA